MTQVLSTQFRHLHSANNYITDADLVEEHNERNEAENTDLCEVLCGDAKYGERQWLQMDYSISVIDISDTSLLSVHEYL